ncbi:MAG TPA: HPr(Ser) kinase/phosphatase [Candidatus Limnocylindria bacterium]|nr:HPr(Ser) kinase/phosphatase [Candidatus Limnocylindria bacterium]
MVNLKRFIEELSLSELSPSARTEMDIRAAELNRPGLELVGYFDHFAYERPQVMGNVEMGYLAALTPWERQEKLEHFFSYDIPCVILCRGHHMPEEMERLAKARDLPVLGSTMTTSGFIVSAITYLGRVLAPRVTMHAVLVDVYGVGILITGDSGVGKSEAALELIKRGHQLVADDVVEITRVNESRLVGESPETVRHFMEIRGIGIIDIRQMFGIGSVLLTKSIDLEIHLEPWNEHKEYERLGLDEQYADVMGVKLPSLTLPVKPGRNLAIIIEVAARNLSLRKLGYSAARELDKRLSDMMRH